MFNLSGLSGPKSQFVLPQSFAHTSPTNLTNHMFNLSGPKKQFVRPQSFAPTNPTNLTSPISNQNKVLLAQESTRLWPCALFFCYELAFA